MASFYILVRDFIYLVLSALIHRVHDLLSNSSSNVGTASGFTHGAAIGDIDNDGDLDIFMNNQQGLEDIGGATSDSFIFLNNGNAVFTGTN